MDKQNDIKDVIIKTTKELLIKQGNVTIKEISSKAFVNVAAINYHFGSKDNLIEIVIKDVINDLRTKILSSIANIDIATVNFEETIYAMFDIVFEFAEANAGIINYSFLQLANQSKAANILIELFITDKEFIKVVTTHLAYSLPNVSDDVLFSKYIILFSSFVVPFFLSFSGWASFFGPDGKNSDALERHRLSYFSELKKIVFV